VVDGDVGVGTREHRPHAELVHPERDQARRELRLSGARRALDEGESAGEASLGRGALARIERRTRLKLSEPCARALEGLGRTQIRRRARQLAQLRITLHALTPAHAVKQQRHQRRQRARTPAEAHRGVEHAPVPD
jgi:hypothetical protein